MITLKKSLADKKKSFHFRPALGSRELFLFANGDRRIESTNINRMVFIEENLLLYQFAKVPKQDDQGRIISDRPDLHSHKTVIAKVNGEIIPQTKETQDYLDNEITGESEIQPDGSVIFTSLNEMRDLIVYKLLRTGVCEIQC